MALPETIFSKVIMHPRDGHLTIRMEVQVKSLEGKLSGSLIVGKMRNGERVIDIYCSEMSPRQMMELSLALREAAQTVAAGGR